MQTNRSLRQILPLLSQRIILSSAKKWNWISFHNLITSIVINQLLERKDLQLPNLAANDQIIVDVNSPFSETRCWGNQKHPYQVPAKIGISSE